MNCRFLYYAGDIFTTTKRENKRINIEKENKRFDSHTLINKSFLLENNTFNEFIMKKDFCLLRAKLKA